VVDEGKKSSSLERFIVFADRARGRVEPSLKHQQIGMALTIADRERCSSPERDRAFGIATFGAALMGRWEQARDIALHSEISENARLSSLSYILLTYLATNESEMAERMGAARPVSAR
jgi:hypothetical protein